MTETSTVGGLRLTVTKLFAVIPQTSPCSSKAVNTATPVTKRDAAWQKTAGLTRSILSSRREVKESRSVRRVIRYVGRHLRAGLRLQRCKHRSSIVEPRLKDAERCRPGTERLGIGEGAGLQARKLFCQWHMRSRVIGLEPGEIG